MRIAPFAMLVLCGCYVTTPVAMQPAPVPGTKLHVQLTDAGTASLAQYLGPNVNFVDGRLLSESDTSMALSVSGTTLRSGDEQYWKGEDISLPHSAIATIQQKKVSWWRSGLLAGGLLAALVSIPLAAGSSSGGPRHSGTGGQQ
ncbi:MAG TPA: hypothetical protein VFW04_04600 [Gemmatimonadaceae bacterium]|nr:hypothetical protein [Gemmatimonadaceae bacterium]